MIKQSPETVANNENGPVQLGFQPDQPFAPSTPREEGLPGGFGFQPDKPFAPTVPVERSAPSASSASSAAKLPPAPPGGPGFAPDEDIHDPYKLRENRARWHKYMNAQLDPMSWHPSIDADGAPVGFEPPQPLPEQADRDGMFYPLGFRAEDGPVGQVRPESSFNPTTDPDFPVGFQPDSPPQSPPAREAGEPQPSATEPVEDMRNAASAGIPSLSTFPAPPHTAAARRPRAQRPTPTPPHLARPGRTEGLTVQATCEL